MQIISTTGENPVSLPALRDHCRLYHQEEDTNLQSALDAALSAWTNDTNRPLQTVVYEQEFEDAPSMWKFQAGPVSSIDSVKWYKHDDETENTVDSGDYRISNQGAWPKLQFLYDYASDDASAGRWVVRWTAYQKPTGDMLRALMMLAATFFDERDALAPIELRHVPFAWRQIVQRWQWGRI